MIDGPGESEDWFAEQTRQNCGSGGWMMHRMS